jgi:hypothetical protein
MIDDVKIENGRSQGSRWDESWFGGWVTFALVISLAFRESFGGVCLFLGADTSTFPSRTGAKKEEVCANPQTACLAENEMAELGRCRLREKR